ncbi:Glucose/Sorbosone dehydrogenase domain-containing protein OS=Streptomyces antimycoticus OX=68175 GN=SSPO_083760 PE=4 SV=1 [Streptomyces antimycoticus]
MLKTDGTLDRASEKTVLEVKTSRGMCCHVGGDIDFDAQGDLHVSTRRRLQPLRLQRLHPHRRAGEPQSGFRRPAQRQGDTNDLRGKILHIKVKADGSYDIQAGNLFAPGTAKPAPRSTRWDSATRSG